MNFKDLQNNTSEIIFRCRLATPATEQEVIWHTEGINAETFKISAAVISYFEDVKTDQANIAVIIDAVCNEFKLDENTLKMHSRKRPIVEARQIAMHLMHKHTKYSLSQIGFITGGFDHATVLHASKTVDDLKDTNKLYAIRLRDIKNKTGCLS